MDGKFLLVVGGTGFIGHQVTVKARQEGYRVLVLSSNDCPEEKRLSDVDYIVADLKDFKQLDARLSGKQIDYVVNIGGYVNHSDFFLQGYSVIQTHLNGVFNLCRCLDLKKIKGFVQIGSSDEYGSLEAPQTEDQRECPISSYSFAKTAANHFLQMLYRESGLPVVILRLFLVYGPGQHDQRFIPQIIQGCLKDECFPASEGQQFRDFCYIDDVVAGVFSALTCTAAFGKLINLGSGTPVRIKDMVEQIRKIIGAGSPLYGKIPYRRGENMALYADIRLAQKVLGWSPKMDLETGIRKTVDYYRDIDGAK